MIPRKYTSNGTFENNEAKYFKLVRKRIIIKINPDSHPPKTTG